MTTLSKVRYDGPANHEGETIKKEDFPVDLSSQMQRLDNLVSCCEATASQFEAFLEILGGSFLLKTDRDSDAPPREPSPAGALFSLRTHLNDLQHSLHRINDMVLHFSTLLNG